MNQCFLASYPTPSPAICILVIVLPNPEGHDLTQRISGLKKQVVRSPVDLAEQPVASTWLEFGKQRRLGIGRWALEEAAKHS